MISDNATITKLWGFKFSNGKKNQSPARPWPSSIWTRRWPLWRSPFFVKPWWRCLGLGYPEKLGKQIPHGKMGKYRGIFPWGKQKRPVLFEVYYRDFCLPIIPSNFPWTKKSFQFSRQGLGGIRWWWSASQRQCTWWTLCADQLHWQCLYLCPQGICRTNQVRIFADFCWVRFLDGILFGEGKMGEKRPRNKALD